MHIPNAFPKIADPICLRHPDQNKIHINVKPFQGRSPAQ